ncbi:MAG: Radical domain protein, partial [Labilithrix sp.]|nr:Radical domain protein [Labilithrix sp.]
DDALARAFAQLRELSARANVARLGRDQGYRIEDVVHVEARGLDASDVTRTTAWLKRRLPPRASVACEAGEGPLSLRARIEPRAPERERTYHVDEGGRVPVESVELHVVEHCNLRCAQCCNVSPYLPVRSLSVSEVRATCDRLRQVVRPDVLKIMGGEPLLHPDVGGVLRAVRESGVAPRIRLFTNGLLLRTLDDDAFAALDELTVSSYASAPMRPEIVAETEERARRFDVVLNVKSVDAFSTVLSREALSTAEAQAAYDACWLRHRCLVVRGGVFYKCTRAAYHADYHALVDVEARDRDGDATQRRLGIPLDAEDFAPRLAAYLGSGEKLASCTHCHGSSGPLAPHVQLRKRDVAAGRLRP